MAVGRVSVVVGVKVRLEGECGFKELRAVFYDGCLVACRSE